MSLEVKAPELNDEQCKAIVIEAMNRELIKTVDGSIPDDINIIRKDANDLVEAAIRARNTGNKSENVETLLFMGQVDMKPLSSQESAPVESSEVQSENNLGIDLTKLSDIVLEGLHTGLEKYINSPEIEEQRAAVLAEQKRRADAGQGIPPAQEAPQEPQAASQGTSERSSRETDSEISDSSSEMGSETQTREGEISNSSNSVQTGNEGIPSADSAQNEDAGSFAGVQATESAEEGNTTAAKSPEEDGRRDELLNKLNFDIIKANKIDISKIESFSNAELERILLTSPDGVKTQEVKDETEEDMSDPSSEKSVSGIIEQPVVAPTLVSKSDFGSLNAESTPTESAQSISPDRENLESQITGPLLKAYGRGRKEVPSIGDHELALMVAYPDAKITQPQLDKARQLDNLASGKSFVLPKKDLEDAISLDVSSFPSSAEAEIAVNKLKEAGLEPVIEKLDEPKDAVSLGQAAKESLDKVEVVETLDDAKNLVSKENKEIEDNVANEKINREIKELEVEKQVKHVDKALDIINRENLPLPPEIDGEPPRLPNDVSKVSRDELFSLHARFHAVESRTNWIVSNHEDELGDIVKLRTSREVVVANDIPLVIDDKRITNEYRDSKVAADKQIMKFFDQEHEVKKVINKLRVLQKNYYRDCERLSRQMSKYEREKNDGPR